MERRLLIMNIKAVKIISALATVGGAVANVIANFATKKEQDAKITEEIANAVAKAVGNKDN